jgi:hypothetical protein
MSPDPSSANFITRPMVCASVCSDQVTRMKLLRELPMLGDISITAR